MKTLTTYVRKNAPWPSPPTTENDSPPVEPDGPSDDIQAVLDVLKFRARFWEGYHEDSEDPQHPEKHRLHLARTNLQKAYLRGTHLQGASLRGTNLTDANCEDADLQEAWLSGAILKNARLIGADLKKAQFSANEDPDFEAADLEGANLRGADLCEADLCGAKGVTGELLAVTCKSLEGAIMPNGQKYEDWLEDKEIHAKYGDGENSGPS